MRQIFKRGFAIIVAFLLCLQMGNIDAKAANVVIALSASSISVGQNVTATVSISGSDISAYTIYVSYNSGVLQYNSASGNAIVNGGGGTVTIVGTSAGSVSISFTAIANGSSGITTSGSEVYDINYNMISISHAGVTVDVSTPSTTTESSNTTESGQTTETTEEDNRSSNCNLASLQVSPGTLSPAFSADRTSYSLEVDKDVTSIVVSAAAEDAKASTSVSGANSIQPGKNTVRITVTAENGAVKVYSIQVQAGEDIGDASVVIDGTEYSFVMSEDNLEVPEGFTSVTAKYKEWEVLAFTSPNKKVTAVCLTDEDGESAWFLMDAEKDLFTPYQEYSSNYNRYIITTIPDGVAVPEGFTETTLKIGGNSVTAYQSDSITDKDIYLVYAINLEGEEGFYEYDAKEQSFLRYVPMIVTEEVVVTATPTVATPSEPVQPSEPDSLFSNPIVIGIMIAAGVVIIILVICVIIFANRIGKQNRELSDAEDMIEQLANANRSVNPELLATLDMDMQDEADGKRKKKKDKHKKDEDRQPQEAAPMIPEEQPQKAVPMMPEGQSQEAVPTIPDVQPQEKIEADESPTTELFSKQEQAIVDSIIPPDVDALVEEVNRDFQNSMASGESYVEKSEKEKAHEDYEKRSMEINNHIMTNYDMTMDSVFAREENNKQ